MMKYKSVAGLVLTPPLSSRRGRIILRSLEKSSAVFAGPSSAKPEPHKCCSFSQGEKVRMRASL
jgi:hypothetical protein